jgi:hypothetical protein
MRPPLLFLAHRLPFPPNKGDKIRSFHLLKHLANDYRVFLGAFADAPEDVQHAAALRELCAEVMVLRLRPWPARLASLRGLLQGQPLTVPYYWRRTLAAWVDRTIVRAGIDRALVFSSAVARVSGISPLVTACGSTKVLTPTIGYSPVCFSRS